MGWVTLLLWFLGAFLAAVAMSTDDHWRGVGWPTTLVIGLVWPCVAAGALYAVLYAVVVDAWNGRSE
jgi:hypothetical protein